MLGTARGGSCTIKAKARDIPLCTGNSVRPSHTHPGLTLNTPIAIAFLRPHVGLVVNAVDFQTSLSRVNIAYSQN